MDSDDARSLLLTLVDAGLLEQSTDPDNFTIRTGDSKFDETDRAILRSLDRDHPESARHIADAVGISLAALRPRLRRLVEEKVIEATAPPTSRNRKYKLP